MLTLNLGADACNEIDAEPARVGAALADTTRSALDRGLGQRPVEPLALVLPPTAEMVFTERPGLIRLRRTSGALITPPQPTDVVVAGEGGMLALALDPDFATNRFAYTCLSSDRNGTKDNCIVRWTIAADGTTLGGRIGTVTGTSGANGRRHSGWHSGCRPSVGPDGQLWPGAGNFAVGTNAQKRTSCRCPSTSTPVARAGHVAEWCAVSCDRR